MKKSNKMDVTFNFTCGNCGHGKEAQDINFVICKRYPPTIIFGNDPSKVFFPVVLKTETCGEHSRKHWTKE